MHRGEKDTVMKKFCMKMGTKISFEITVPRIQFLGKEWILKSHFCKNCLLVSDNNFVVTTFVTDRHPFLFFIHPSKNGMSAFHE